MAVIHGLNDMAFTSARLIWVLLLLHAPSTKNRGPYMVSFLREITQAIC